MTRWPSLRVNVARIRAQTTHGGPIDRDSGPARIEVAETVASSDAAITTARIEDGTDVDVRGSVIPTTSGVEFVGHVTSTWTGECRRCVEEVTGAIDADVRATFLDDPDAVDLSPDAADAYPIEGDWIDLGDVVFEELMLGLPLTPLCAETCQGSDPERFPAVVDGEGGTPIDENGEPAEPDPRWAVLSEITFDED